MRFFLLFVFCSPFLLCAQINDSLILVTVAPDVALYKSNQISNEYIFTNKELRLPAIQYYKEKNSVYQFIKIVYDGSYYWILTGPANISRANLDVLKFRSTLIYADTAEKRYDRELSAFIKKEEATERSKKQTDSILEAEIQRISSILEAKQHRKDSINSLKALRNGRIYGLSILEYDVTGNDYWTGISISFYNFSQKKIKYIWITLKAINPVGDVVSIQKVEAIGPIRPKETGTYNFDHIFTSRVIRSVKMIAIKVLYFDGTVKMLNQAQVLSVLMPENTTLGY